MSQGTIRVAAAALNQTALDLDGNTDRILRAMKKARAEGSKLLCLPELCVTGYGCEDMFFAEWLAERAWQNVETRIAPETTGLAVVVGLPVVFNNTTYNAAVLLCDGKVRGVVPKQYLANDGIHYEHRWFTPWPRGKRDFLAGQMPIGDWLFSFCGVRVGFEICEDAWVPHRPAAELCARGVHIVVNPSASHYAFGKKEYRDRLVLDGSSRFSATYLFANLLGNEAGRAIYDGRTLIAEGGQTVAAGPPFSFQESTLACADIPRPKSREGVKDEGVVELGLELSTADDPQRTVSATKSGPETRSMSQEEEFTRAITLGLFDYLRKSRSRGYVVSLSGGVDSATCAVLIAEMVHAGVKELGVEGFRGQLGWGRDDAPWTDAKEAVRALLTTVYQATASSSSTTRAAAQAVADALSSEHHVLEMEPIVDAYRNRVATMVGRELSWEQDDFALQNIQSRVRAPSVWMLANIKGKLLCATGNRSEASVGYMTMDGDTAGGICPIAGIDKPFLRRWLKWAEITGTPALGRLSALSSVNRQAPTAELRPPGAHQTDEDDLMPFEVLDTLERAFLVERLSPTACLRRLTDRFTPYSESQLRTWADKFFALWSRNQWKRERVAPAFHLDVHSVDPKTWCRFPILSGSLLNDSVSASGRSGERGGGDQS